MSGTSEEMNKPQNNKKCGLQIMGYVVPWWIVVVIVLLIIYVMCEHGVFGSSNGMHLPEIFAKNGEQVGGGMNAYSQIMNQLRRV